MEIIAKLEKNGKTKNLLKSFIIFRPQSPLEFVKPFTEQESDFQVGEYNDKTDVDDITEVQVIAVGSMVQLETQHGEQLCGVVRYCGDIPGRTGRWAGVEMEEEVRGGSNGWAQVNFPTC